MWAGLLRSPSSPTCSGTSSFSLFLQVRNLGYRVKNKEMVRNSSLLYPLVQHCLAQVNRTKWVSCIVEFLRLDGTNKKYRAYPTAIWPWCVSGYYSVLQILRNWGFNLISKATLINWVLFFPIYRWDNQGPRSNHLPDPVQFCKWVTTMGPFISRFLSTHPAPF